MMPLPAHHPLRTNPLIHGHPPAWASGWGQDRYGPFLELTVSDITQRLRWIPPGRFLMGSPEDEEGRYDGEGPQLEVVMADGFWLFDTPCTQALWVAVMGRNPSYFKGNARRPVEQVSWQDVQAFLNRINQLVPGVNLTLPSERQWEYACRAGTSTATYGPLAEIAWYDDNSERTTHPVGEKAANDWGLYDILGNVLEWCADLDRPYGVGSPDETDSLKTEAIYRVVCGGSWGDSARNVRADYYDLIPSQNQSVFLGFRCAPDQTAQR